MTLQAGASDAAPTKAPRRRSGRCPDQRSADAEHNEPPCVRVYTGERGPSRCAAEPELHYLTSQRSFFHTLLGIQLSWAVLCFCFVQSFMFYEGYNIDSEGSTVNIRGRRGEKTPFCVLHSSHTLTQRPPI